MLPLDGIKVLDVSQIMAGPYCTMVLGDMGAEVIKVEKANGGDDSRQMGPYVEDESTCFAQINRNKKSISLNLKEEKGREVFYRLAKEADVVVENYRPGVTQSLKIDYDSLKAINPGLIYCSISGYGQTGPSRHKGGFDLVAQGMSGLMSMTGEPGRRPLKTGVAVYDIGAGLTAIYSILAAYIHRQRSGEGQHLDIAIAECGLPWFTWEAGAYFSEGRVPEATGWRHRVSAPYQAMRVRDGYMMLGCANQRTWERFCEDVIERPELMVDERFKTNLDRGANVEALEAILEDILGQQDRAYWLDRCDAAGVPAGPINDFDQAMHDEHYLAREMVLEVDHPTMGRMKTLGFPSKFSATPLAIRQPAPLFAQHTDEVLGEIGLAADEIDALRQQGAVR
ncbi:MULTISPECIES: CoA transferase [unclassified Halomonas]|uniref:CoA transferase n=2 Tax=unclassified Halomonas TaxID=2609666 RepID=A0AAU7KF70_9GAMM|nr:MULTISPECIES: CoA transferase [unclassified Halomonas]MBR9770903.1 CoA transferase [Gammaproteobacteria bacterium]MBS8269371.1 CoA transferase [Halomonas litopenaei]KJZ17219.1 CoA-transferase [Halomonas sp. S2151]MAR71418.1 CoA transferase [Halomonas sp.]MBR9879513.1 CoA transferase [Gammaproteobacteria bacterium]|tara:strand:- start:105 stop:1292 length:1188 start_codon:yes stop_codon:yes gene_type:complete